jgi:predicted secreted protein
MSSVRAHITLTLGGAAVGLLRSASLNVDVGLVEAAPESVYGWAEHLPAVRSWSAQGSVFIPLRGADDALVTLKQAMAERSTLACVVAYQTSEATETGTAVIASLELAAGVGGALEGNIQLTGTGGLTLS